MNYEHQNRIQKGESIHALRAVVREAVAKVKAQGVVPEKEVDAAMVAAAISIMGSITTPDEFNHIFRAIVSVPTLVELLQEVDRSMKASAVNGN